MTRVETAIAAALLLVVLAPSTRGVADQYVVYVQPPSSGGDDTAALQTALNTCVQQHHTGCTVQLRAGTYHTQQLVTYNFHGTFKGSGIDQTTIEAIPNLPVTGFPDCLQPIPKTCLWPDLIIFVDGDIQVSNLSIKITAPPGTATVGWQIPVPGFPPITSLLDAVRFMGKQNPTNVSIDRISIEGLPDDSPTSLVGFNVINGVVYNGELQRSATSFDYYFLSGSLTVRNSLFKTMFDGVGQGGFVRSSRVTIGGSPTDGNSFENVIVGMDLESSESSIFDISYNASSGITNSMWVIPWQPAFVPSSPSQYFIHDNDFSTTGDGPGVQGILLDQEDRGSPLIQATIWNNSLKLQGARSNGIDAHNTKDTVIRGNTLTGTGFDAIGLFNSTYSSIISNNVGGFTPVTGSAQIHLDPSTSHDFVVCGARGNTVLDEGSNNRVVGCPLTMTTRSEARK